MAKSTKRFMIILQISTALMLFFGCSKGKVINSPTPVSWNPKITEEEVLLPGGEFLFAGKIKVRVDSFYIDKTPVTNFQFNKFCETVNFPPVTKCNFGEPFWTTKGIVKGFENHPVICIEWDLARRYCQSKGKRLPTEAELEFAAGLGKTQKYAWGNKMDRNKLNSIGNEGEDKWNATSPVGAFPPNDSGIYDLCGNVWEWCSDPYDEGWLDSLIVNNKKEPVYLENPKGMQGSTSNLRVLKGGSWHNKAKEAAITNRDYLRTNLRFRNVGFRCVRDTRPKQVAKDTLPVDSLSAGNVTNK